MFADWDNYQEDDETLEVVRRYRDMLVTKNHSYFDLYEFEFIIDFFIEQFNFKDAFDAVRHALSSTPTLHR